MCGILVWINAEGNVDPQKMFEALALMRHRGPDAQRCLFYGGVSPEKSVLLDRPDTRQEPIFFGLGHARLSIIDVSESAHQPMISPAGSAIVFNGEIYNYIELRDTLPEHHFRTKSDTEVLLHLLERDGTSCLKNLNGMWGLAFFDPRKGQITFARDRYGKKPLFWYQDETNVIVASECKAIFSILGQRRQLNPDFLYGQLISKDIPTLPDNQWFYKEIHTIPRGGGVLFDLRTLRTKDFTGDLIENYFNDTPSPDALAEEVESSITLRMRADVPVGAFLSGGVDSCTIAGVIADNPTFRENTTFYILDTLNREDTVYADKLVKTAGLRAVHVHDPATPEDRSTWVRDLIRHFEIPFPFWRVGFPTWLVTKKMAEDGIRVALDGTGGDEIFSGYPSFFDTCIANAIYKRKIISALRMQRQEELSWPNLRKNRLKRRIKIFRRSLLPKRPCETIPSMRRAKILSSLTTHASCKNLMHIAKCVCLRDTQCCFTKAQKIDLTCQQMPAYLYMTDMSSMHNSVEVRSPFLDYRLAKYTNLEDKHKFTDGYNKYLLRKCMPGIVPDAIRWRRSKEGFATENYFTSGKSEIINVKDVLNDSKIIRELFKADLLSNPSKNKISEFITSSSGALLLALGLLEDMYDIVL